jgi:hypothetical protein
MTMNFLVSSELKMEVKTGVACASSLGSTRWLIRVYE